VRDTSRRAGLTTCTAASSERVRRAVDASMSKRTRPGTAACGIVDGAMQPAAPIIVAVIGGQVVGVSLDSGPIVWRYAMEGAIAPPRIHVTAHHVFVAGPVLACLDYPGGVYWHVAAPKTHNHPGTMRVQDGRLLFGLTASRERVASLLTPVLAPAA
jgi:hypothetical protein